MTTVETEAGELYWDPFDTEIDADPYEHLAADAGRGPRLPQRHATTSGPCQPLRRRRGRPPRPGHVQLRPRHRARAHGPGPVAAGHDDLPGPARAQPVADPGLPGLHAPAHRRSSSPTSASCAPSCSTPTSAASGSTSCRTSGPNCRRWSSPSCSACPRTSGRTCATPSTTPSTSSPASGMINDFVARGPHPAARQYLQAIIERPPGAPPRRHDHRPGPGRDRPTSDGTTRRLTDEECNELRQPPGQRRHRDRRPPARLGRGDARRPPRPAGRAGRRRRAAARTPSRSCCATRRPSPVQGRWTTERDRAPRQDHPRGLEGAAAHRLGRAATSASTPTPTASTSTAPFDHHVSFGYGIHFCLGRRPGPHGGPHRPRGDPGPLPRVAGRPRRRQPPAHQHRAGLGERPRSRLTFFNHLVDNKGSASLPCGQPNG